MVSKIDCPGCEAVLDSPNDIVEKEQIIGQKYLCRFCDTELGDMGEALYNKDP